MYSGEITSAEQFADLKFFLEVEHNHTKFKCLYPIVYHSLVLRVEFNHIAFCHKDESPHVLALVIFKINFFESAIFYL